MNRWCRLGFAAGLVAAEIAAVVVLHRLGRAEGFALPDHAVGRWLANADTETLVAVAARIAGLVLAWWLLLATVLSLTHRLVPAWRHVHALDTITPAALRRMFDRAVLVGLGASIAFTGMRPAGATSVPSAPPGVDVPVVRTAPRVATRAPRAPARPAVAPSDRAIVVVRAGDNLWVIAERALRENGTPAGPAQIAPYWRRVIAANTSGLRSHDPNLIYPGERVLLPPLDPPSG